MRKIILKNIKAFLRLFGMMFYSYYLKKRHHVVADGNVKLSFFGRPTVFEGRNRIHFDVNIESSYIGLGTYIGPGCKLPHVKIGRFCSLGHNIKTVTANHPTSVFVSTHPAFYSLQKQSGFTFTNKQLFEEHQTCSEQYDVVIGNDVWIGSDVNLLGGIRIGDGAVIATGAVVTKDVEPYSIVGGVPAKLIKKRFDPAQIIFLLELKWWNQNIEWIKNNSTYFSDIEIFMNQTNIYR